jgi:nucleoside-diphosphate-sugar epimerase
MTARDAWFESPPFLTAVDSLGALAKAKIAITGHRGVLGGLLHQRLAAAGVRPATFAGDITDRAAVETFVRDAAPELVFHFAAVVPVTTVDADPARAWAVNALGPYHLAAAVLAHAPRAWLFLASSSHVYAARPKGDRTPISEDAPLAPAGFYGTSKLAGERVTLPLLERLGTRAAVARIFSFTHASQKPPYLVPSLRESIAALADGAELPLRSPGAVRDLLDAEAVIDAALHLARARFSGVVNVGSGVGRTVEEIAQLVAARLGKRIVVRPVPGTPEDGLVADVSVLRRVIGS